MVERAPRNMDEWVRSIERKLAEARRAISSVPVSYYEKTITDSLADRTRTPTAPVELTAQTALYTDGVLARQYGRVMVDFPDVTKATDGTEIPIAGYELWGRDDSLNYLESTTGAVPGAAAPGLTFPGLAKTPAMKAAAAASIGAWKRVATSAASALRVDGLVPGSIWSFKVRALGTYTIAPGNFSSVLQVQVSSDTTPPPQPTKPIVTVSRGAITVRWDGQSVLGAMPGDLSHIIMSAGTSSSPTAEVDRYFSGGGLSVLADLEYNKPVFIRFQAVDLSGNRSNWSEQVTGIPTPLVDTDVILSEIDGAKTVIKNVAGDALRDGAVRAEKLADNAVQQKHLADAVISAAKLESTVTDAINKGIDDAATAQGAATAANTAAGAAQTAADAAKQLVQDVIASGINMVQNGNFDLPITSPVTGWPNRVLTYVEEDARARSGTNVMRSAPTASISYAYSDYQASAKDRTYVAEMWVRLAAPAVTTTGDSIGFYFSALSDAGASAVSPVTNDEGLTVANLSETTWTRVSRQYKITQAGNVKLRVGPRFVGQGNVYLIDDFKLVDVTDRVDALAAAAAAQLRADQAWEYANDSMIAAGQAQTAANGKVTAYYTNTAPAGTGYKANDIWFRGTDNKIHLWDPTANSGAGGWVARADAAIATAQAAAVAAGSAASTADGKAVAAQQAADGLSQEMVNVKALQATEKTRLDTVQTTANGKNKVTYSVTAPGTTANTAGDIWFQRNGTLIIGQWEGLGGTGWASRTIDGLIIANIDAGTITTGYLAAARIAAGSITADKVVIGVGANMLVDPGFEDDTRNTNRIGTGSWTVGSNAADGKFMSVTGLTTATDLRLDNTVGEVFTADPRGAYSMVLDTDAPTGGLQGYLVVTYADGTAASGPFIKTFAGLDGTRKQVALIWEFDKLLNASGSPVKTFRAVVRRPAGQATGVVTNVYSARFSTAMTGQMMVDGTITATNIAAGSLTSASGIFGDINASVISSGTINAARLNAADIRAKFLAAGKIVAAEIEGGTITVESGIIGSLDIGKVTTGQLDGIFIKANTIAVNHLRVSDLTNFAPSYAESPTDWELSTGLTNVATAIAGAYDGRRFQSLATDGTIRYARGPWVMVSPGEELYATGQMYRTGPTTNSMQLRYYFYDKVKAFVQSAAVNLDGSAVSTALANGAVQEIKAVVPAGATYARLLLVINNSTGDDIGMYNVKGYKRFKGNLVVDGTITGDKAAVNTFTAKHILVGDFANVAVGSDFDDASAVPWALNANHILSTTQKRSGTASLRMGPNAAAQSSLLVADTRVKEGEEWLFTYWAYLDATFNGTTGNSKIRVGDQANTALKHITYASVPKGSWQKVTDSVVIGAGVTSLTVQLWSDNTAGYAYIDNIEIRRKSEASLIRELGVEQLTAGTAGINQAVIDKLWADVVNSRKITAEMLTVTGENLLTNSYGQFGNNKDWSDWTWDGADKPDDGRVTGSFYITGGAAGPLTKNLANNAAPMPVSGDSWYVFEGYIKANIAGSRVFLEFMEDNGINPSPQYALASYVVPTTWTPFSVKVKTSPGQKTMYMRMFGNHSAGTVTTALQKIAGMRFRPAIGSDLVVDGSILATHLGVDSVTAAAIKALSITGGHIAANTIESDNLKTGSVTALKLAAELILATKILAGPANDTHAEMSPQGFRVYGKDALGNINEVVRLGVASTGDYLAVTNSAQELVATISADGTISSRKVVTDELVYKGEDMQVVLDRASLGLVAWGQFNGNQLPATIANGTERGLFEIAWEPVGTRMYAVSCSPVLFTPNAQVATAAAFRMRYTTDGSQPTTTSPILAEDFKPILATGSWTMSFQFADRLVGGFNGSYVRVLFSIAASNGNGLITELGQSPTFAVKDLGPAYPKAGVLSNQVGGGGGGSRPPVVTRKKYYTAVDRRSYLPNDSVYNYDTTRMYQGPSPAGVGQLKSMAFFNSMTADLSGATIEDMQVYIYFDHWYNNSGGIAKIGLHGHTGAIPSTFNWAGWIMDSGGWPKPGGRWLKIPSQYWNGFKTGAYRGITLGMNTVGNEHYGIANGSPQIYVQYTV